jgi:hypothetical protein
MKHTKQIVAALIVSAPLILTALPSAHAQQSTPARIYIRPTGRKLTAAQRQWLAQKSMESNLRYAQMNGFQLQFGLGSQPLFGPSQYPTNTIGPATFIDPYLGPFTDFAAAGFQTPGFGMNPFANPFGNTSLSPFGDQFGVAPITNQNGTFPIFNSDGTFFTPANP